MNESDLYEFPISLETFKQQHIYDTDFKLKHFGYGEWIEEPDTTEFIYRDYECRIIRMIIREPIPNKECYFGGYLCAYVKIPESHEYYLENVDDIGVSCPWGLSYAEMHEDGFWIGFDCGHSNDIIPSMERMINDNSEMSIWKKDIQNLRERYGQKCPEIFRKAYKNIDFCIEECKNIVNQLIEDK